jgi:HSP20 family protein
LIGVKTPPAPGSGGVLETGAGRRHFEDEAEGPPRGTAVRQGAAATSVPNRRQENEMANLNVYDPFADAGIDELFRGFFKPVRVTQAAPVTIRMDVTENDKGYVVHAEIPGVRKEDIHVTIEANQVTIGAEVKRESEHREGERVLRSERHYGSVHRSFTLPVELDEAASTAKYENGVLELTLARKPALAGRQLTVQ